MALKSHSALTVHDNFAAKTVKIWIALLRHVDLELEGINQCG